MIGKREIMRQTIELLTNEYYIDMTKYTRGAVDVNPNSGTFYTCFTAKCSGHRVNFTGELHNGEIAQFKVTL